MSIKFQVKRANTATWSSINPVLESGEIGFETDTYGLKIGNGSNTWANLAYISGTPTTNASLLTSGTLSADRLPQLTSFQVLGANNGVVLSGSEGSIELFRQDGLAFIDLKSGASEDFDCRIQQQANGLSFFTGGDGSTAERMRLKSNGQMRLVPLASDPDGAEDGDVYYNSTFNSLRTRSNGSWSNLTSNIALTPFARAETNAETRTVEAKLRDTVCVFDFMTAAEIADVTSHAATLDVRQAIQDAVTAARGKILYFPAGSYFINPANGTILLDEVTILGEYVRDMENTLLVPGDITNPAGTFFRIASTGSNTSPFTIRAAVTIDGVQWYYNGQVATGTPTAYAPTLVMDDANGYAGCRFFHVRNCIAYNSWIWLDLKGTNGIGHVWIENNSVCGINKGINIDKNVEVVKILGNTFTYGIWNKADVEKANQVDGVPHYMLRNAVAVYYKRGDGIWFCDNLVFGYKVGLLMEVAELVNLCIISDNAFDAVPFAIAATANGANANFTKCVISGNIFNSYGAAYSTLNGSTIVIGTSGSAITDHILISGNDFAACRDDAIVIQGNNTKTITVVGNQFEGLAREQTTGVVYCVSVKNTATNADLLFTGNYVWQDNQNHAGAVDVQAGKNIGIHSNIFRYCKKVLNVTACENLHLTGNLSRNTVDSACDDISGVTGTLTCVGNDFEKPSATIAKLDVPFNVTATDGTNRVFLNRTGSIEIQNTNGDAFIDLKSGASEDFDCRIQQQANGLSFFTGGDGSTAERIRFKSNGQIKFVPLSSDPGGAEDGDVYYNSSVNKLKVRANGVLSNIATVFVRDGSGAGGAPSTLVREIETKLKQDSINNPNVRDYFTPAQLATGFGGFGAFNQLPPVTNQNTVYEDNTIGANGDSIGIVANKTLWHLVPNTVVLPSTPTGIILNIYEKLSPQTSANGLCEMNAIRCYTEITEEAGKNLHYHFMNTEFDFYHNCYDSQPVPNEAGILLGTMRARGPANTANGGNARAIGVWGGDLHVEKAANVAFGAMVGCEIGVHTASPHPYSEFETSYRQNGIELWSGNRIGGPVSNNAVRAHDALKIKGDAGWENFIRCRHTNDQLDVVRIRHTGVTEFISPSNNMVFTAGVATNDRSAQFLASGRTSTGNLINTFIVSEPDIGVVGTQTNHPLQIRSNNTSRLVAKTGGQMRFVPLTSDPDGAEDGDVYYNSTFNRLRIRAGGAWSNVAIN